MNSREKSRCAEGVVVDRELVLLILVPAVAGPLMSLAGRWMPRRREGPCATSAERVRWRDLWMPCVPVAVFVALLLGWAMTEPEHAEAAHGLIAVLATVFTAVWIRALLRSAWSLLRHSAEPPACTVGLLRPRVYLSKALLDVLDPEAIEAARAHEEAHARHHDPLRLWLGQFVTDLQWPAAAPRERLQAWQRTLELARDEEARWHGVRGEDLAAAIVEAARLGPITSGSSAALLGNGSRLRERIRRALAPLTPPPPKDSGSVHRAIALLVVCLGAAVAGVQLGESLMRMLLR